MDIIHPKAEAYAAGYTSAEDALLAEINAYTSAEHPQAHMLSGQVQGQFLKILCAIAQPKHVLEIGTFTGYSALSMAQGLPENAALHTIELRDADADIAASFFARSNRNKQITLHRGNALELIDTLDYTWDFVFIDADKTGYIEYYEKIVPRLAPNGMIVADNVLFHGQVLEDPINGKNAKAIHAFNEHVQLDPRTEQVMLTVRDGLTLIKKK